MTGFEEPIIELPRNEEGGGPAGVKVPADDGGRPAGVFEGLAPKLNVLSAPFLDRLSGVEGGLEENGT